MSARKTCNVSTAFSEYTHGCVRATVRAAACRRAGARQRAGARARAQAGAGARLVLACKTHLEPGEGAGEVPTVRGVVDLEQVEP